MDSFLWWSGVAAWFLLGSIGLLWLIDEAIDWIVDGLYVKREFLAFVAYRLKARAHALKDHVSRVGNDVHDLFLVQLQPAR